MRLTCSSLSLFSARPDEAIAIVAELGFPAIDLVGIPTLPPSHVDYAGRDPGTLQALVEAVGHAGIEVATIVAIPTDGLDHWDATEIDARVAWAVRACEALQCRRLVLDAGNPPADGHIERSADIARWKAMIDAAFVLTSAAGVTLTVEAPHTGTLAERFDEVQELVAALDNPAIRLDYDTSHVARSATSTDDGLEVVGDRLEKVALRDVDADGEFCRPGTGRVDFAHVFARLRERGYTGDLVIELETEGIEDVAGQRREIELTKAYVEGLLASR
jgi:sugar phosphate isomerase/epimerase